MILEQNHLECLAHASYLIRDEETGIAVVMDSLCDIDGHIDDNVNPPFDYLKDRIAEVLESRPLIVRCTGGCWSAMAISILGNQGFTGVIDSVGSRGAWEAFRLDTVS